GFRSVGTSENSFRGSFVALMDQSHGTTTKRLDVPVDSGVARILEGAEYTLVQDRSGQLKKISGSSIP
ncbi:MAG: hypothetical protein AB2767_08750, partial [Candidatus Thiodiazotropha taylori]